MDVGKIASTPKGDVNIWVAAKICKSELTPRETWTPKECEILMECCEACGNIPLSAARMAAKLPSLKHRNVDSIQVKARRLLKRKGIPVATVSGDLKSKWSYKETKELMEMAQDYPFIMSAAKAYNKIHPERSISGAEGKIRLLISQGRLPPLNNSTIPPTKEPVDYYTMDVGIHNIKIREQIFAEMGV